MNSAYTTLKRSSIGSKRSGSCSVLGVAGATSDAGESLGSDMTGSQCELLLDENQHEMGNAEDDRFLYRNPPMAWRLT